MSTLPPAAPPEVKDGESGQLKSPAMLLLDVLE
jgi:hypothetical protein